MFLSPLLSLNISLLAYVVHKFFYYNNFVKHVKTFCAICLSKNLVHDVLKGDIDISFVSTKFQLEDIFSKPHKIP